MTRRLAFIILMMVLSLPAGARECVVLIHGLARTADSMTTLAQALDRDGYAVANVDYPSTEKPVEELAEIAVAAGIRQCKQAGAMPINFVTHSLGGILVRYYFRHHEPESVNKVVMMGPPNQGSEVVDRLKNMPGFEWWNGPAGMELGTGSDDLPRRLGPVNFDLGVIAGTRSLNVILSTFLPDPDDGKVSIADTRVSGMCAFIALPVTHTFMMRDERVIRQVKHFLAYGEFTGERAQKTCESPPSS